MKRPQFLILLLLSLAIFSCQSGINKESGDSEPAVYNIKLPNKRDMQKEDLHQSITLNSQKTNHQLDFGVFTTVSAIAISGENKPDSLLLNQHKNPGEKQIIDITGWDKGTYRVQFTAIAESVTFWLEVK